MQVFLSDFYSALGRTFQVLLFGFLAAQLARYHESFPSDQITLKAVASTSFLLSLALTIVVIFEIVQVGKSDRLLTAVEQEIPVMIVLLNGFLMFVSQIFFSWRIRQISQKKWLQILICIFAVLQGAGSIAYAAVNSRNLSLALFKIAEFFPSVWMAGNILCDLTITLSMLFFLRQARVAAVFKPTQTMLGRILTFTLETGLITTIWMVVQLIMWQPFVKSALYGTFFYPSGTLYSVWLLATLNARSSFNKDLPSFIDAANLPTVPGEMHFKHPNIEGTEIVISITTNSMVSYGESLEVESDSYRAHESQGTGKQSEDVLA